jgi:hypothetical protein
MGREPVGVVAIPGGIRHAATWYERECRCSILGDHDHSGWVTFCGVQSDRLEQGDPGTANCRRCWRRMGREAEFAGWNLQAAQSALKDAQAHLDSLAALYPSELEEQWEGLG